MTPPEIALALAIFSMRILNYAVGTIRLVVITRGRRVLASMLASVEAFIFAVVIANVVSNLENIPNLVAYCAGAALGSYVGMVLESRLVKGYMIVNVITHRNGHDIAVTLRNAGFGVTESSGEGRDGAVVILRSVINRRDVRRLTELVQQVSPQAFVAIEEAHGVQHGWLDTGRGGKFI